MLTSKNAAIQPKQSNRNRPESTKSQNAAPPHMHTHMHMIQSCTRTRLLPPLSSPSQNITHTHTHIHTLAQLNTGPCVHSPMRAITADKN